MGLAKEFAEGNIVAVFEKEKLLKELSPKADEISLRLNQTQERLNLRQEHLTQIRTRLTRLRQREDSLQAEQAQTQDKLNAKIREIDAFKYTYCPNHQPFG